MVKKTTDVHGSIAGYYYQILLACRELTGLANIGDYVGIEVGADIRIIRSGNKTSVEAKFHKGNMGLYHKDIVKTMYNFYKNSSSDEKLIFRTNVSPTKDYRKIFIDDWCLTTNTDSKCQFIKKCLLRHSVEHDNSCIRNFQKYKKDINKKYHLTNDKDNNFYIEELEKEIFIKNIPSKSYTDYAITNDSITYEDFVNKLSFEFEGVRKMDSIKKIKSDIIKNIQNSYSSLGLLIEECTQILNLLVDKFFISVVSNAEKTNPTFDVLEKISLADVDLCVNNFRTDRLLYLANEEFNKILYAIEVEEEEFIELLDTEYEGTRHDEIINRYQQILDRFLRYMIDKKRYDSLVSRYSLGLNQSFSAIIKAIQQITILSVFRECSEKSISFFKEDRLLDNIFLEGLINYCFKNCTSTNIRTTKSFIKTFHNETKGKYNVKNSQIVVISANFRDGGKPCQRKKGVLPSAVLDCAQVTENANDLKLYNSLDYRCNDVIGQAICQLVGQNKCQGDGNKKAGAKCPA